MKRVLIFIAIFSSISLASALTLNSVNDFYSFNNKQGICNQTYYFVINHLSENNISYSESDLSLLSNDIFFRLNVNLNSSLEDYLIKNFRNICYPYTILRIPESSNVGELKINKTTPSEICSLEVSPLFGLSIPLPIIYVNLSCDGINFWKYIFKLDKEGENTIINGIRIWYFLLFFICLLIASYLKTNGLIYKLVRSIK